MAEVTLLDGAIGQELAHRGQAEDDPLWSTSVMARTPEKVGALHRDYFEAGATWATTNTYALLPDRLVGTPLEPALDALVATARQQAVAARDAAGGGRIAGAMGPLGATYRGDLRHGVDQALRDYAPIVKGLEGAVDVFLAETIASLHEAKTLVAAMAELTDTPLWLAFTVSDDDGTRLRSGEPVEGIAEVIGHAGAVLLNCSKPEAISAGLPALAGLGLRFGAYANGFTGIADAFLGEKPTVNALSIRDDLGPERYAEVALDWVEAGATIVGGCCEVGPAYIATLRQALEAAGHRVV